MKTVTSKDNPALKKARKLLARRGREKESAFLTEGKKLINEAISAGHQAECVFINATALINGEAVAGQYVNECLLEEKLFYDLAQTQTPQPYIAVMNQKQGAGLNKGEPVTAEKILILDRISDPGNVGTMMRTALATGIDELWCVKGTADVFSDKAIRASAGAVFHLSVREELSADFCVDKAREIGAKIVVCDSGGIDLYDSILTGSLAIVIGSESAGPQEEFLAAADAIVGIPMSSVSESLNAATAAAIVMYEALRQREVIRKGV